MIKRSDGKHFSLGAKRSPFQKKSAGKHLSGARQRSEIPPEKEYDPSYASTEIIDYTEYEYDNPPILSDSVSKAVKIDRKTKAMAVSRRTGKKRRSLIVGGTVAAVFFAIIGAVVLFVNGKLNRISYDPANADSTKEISVKAANEAVSIDLDAYELRDGSGEKPTGEIFSDKDIYNLLIIGSDMKIPGTEDRGRADMVMLASLNTKEPVLSLASFERAMGMPVKGEKDIKLNEMLNKGGAALIEDTIDQCFLTDTMGYIHIDYDSFKVIVDAIGGVDIEMDELEASFFNGRITMDVHSEFVAQAGMNHLDGYEALVYCRLRNSDDNWVRQGRTRLVMEAAVKKVLGMSLSEINALADELLPIVHTNLTKKQITTLMMQIPKLSGLTVKQEMFPAKDKIWVYHGAGESAMFGCDYKAESERLKLFLYGDK